MHDFQGQIITTGLTAQQLFEMVKIAVRQVNEEEKFEQGKLDPDAALPDLLSSSEAAAVLRYKSHASLRQWHTTSPGLAPIRRGRALFYRKEQVLKIRDLLFGFKKKGK